MPNVVLLQPRIGDMDQFRDRPTPPVGLLTAASLLPGDIELRLVDQRLERDWAARVAERLDADTVAVGITALTGGMVQNGLAMAAEVRRLRDVPIVWGGVHASLLPEETILDPLVDYVVEGEGEAAFAQLVSELRAGRSDAEVPGVWRKDGAGGVVRTPRAPLMRMDDLPGMRDEAVDMEPYIGRFLGRRMVFYQGSRGCPHECRYCYNNVFNQRRWRAASPERVLADVDRLRRRYDAGSVYLLDDNFFIDKRRAMAILEGLQRQGLHSVLQGVDVDTLERLSDDELDFIEQAGVVRISVGLESGDDRVRNRLLKKIGDVATLKRQMQRLAGRRLLVLASFVVGFPGETLPEIRRSVDLALWTLGLGDNFRMPVLYNYVPFPGTPLFQELRADGFPFPTTLEGWGRYEWENVVMRTHPAATLDYLERVTFVSRFLDRKEADFGFEHRAMRLAYRLYRPFAWQRMRRGLLRPLPERALYLALRDRVSR